MTKALLLSAAAGLALFIDIDGERRDTKKDHERIQGAWRVVAIERGGKADATPPDLVMTFTGSKLRVRRPGGDTSDADFRLGPAAKFGEIDLFVTDGNEKGKSIPGIYALDGDRLTLCIEESAGKPRPSSFKTNKDSRLSSVTLERVKENKQP